MQKSSPSNTNRIREHSVEAVVAGLHSLLLLRLAQQARILSSPLSVSFLNHTNVLSYLQDHGYDATDGMLYGQRIGDVRNDRTGESCSLHSRGDGTICSPAVDEFLLEVYLYIHPPGALLFQASHSQVRTSLIDQIDLHDDGHEEGHNDLPLPIEASEESGHHQQRRHGCITVSTNK